MKKETELKHRKIPTREEMREMARKILAKEPTGKSPMLPETEEEFNAALRESEEQIKRGEYIDWDIAKL